MQAYREGSSAFGEVRIQRTSSNHCEEEGSRATGKVRVSLGRFDYTEPPRITMKKGKAGLQGRSRTTFIEPPQTTVMKGEAGRKGSLESVRGGSTALNLLEPLCCRGKQAYREGSSEFGADRPHRTSSNHCDEGGCRHTGKVRVSSVRFEYTEPPRITVTKGLQSPLTTRRPL